MHYALNTYIEHADMGLLVICMTYVSNNGHGLSILTCWIVSSHKVLIMCFNLIAMVYIILYFCYWC